METDASLGWAAQVVVLHAKPPKNAYRAIVHAHRDREMILPHRPAQQFTYARLQSECFGYLVKLCLGHFESIEFFTHDQTFRFLKRFRFSETLTGSGRRLITATGFQLSVSLLQMQKA
jgi:hypothetical protein